MSIQAYAAKAPKAALEPFTYEPGPLGPQDVEVKVSHCGICHSDLAMIDNDWGFSTYPLVPGHEVIGTVSAIGSEVELHRRRSRGSASAGIPAHVASANGAVAAANAFASKTKRPSSAVTGVGATR